MKNIYKVSFVLLFYSFVDLTGVIGYVLSSSSNVVVSVQENILSDNELGNIVQSVFDDVSSIVSPKQVISTEKRWQVVITHLQ